VRCECRRQKQKWPCSQVRAVLAKATGSGVYDSGSLSLKLLACDGECAAQAQSKAKKGPAAETAAGAAPAPAAATEAVGSEGGGSGGGGTSSSAKPSAKSMSRAERMALAEQRAKQQLAAEKRKKQWGQGMNIAFVVVLVIATLLLAKFLYGLLLVGDDPANREL